jgi:saccharopine dehydrogenase-like NADP-dependent oxidoreductase
MRVTAEGSRAGEPTRLCWDLLDHYDTERGFSSMARTTGFPCTLLARELVAGSLPRTGVLVPEELGADTALVERILAGLAARGVTVRSA